MSKLVLQSGVGSLARLAAHRNAGLEIVFVRRGHLLWQTEGVAEPVPPGAVYFTLPEQEHGSAEEFEPGHEWIYVILAPGRRGPLHPALGFSLAEAAEIEGLLRESRRHSLGGGAAMEGWLAALVEEERAPGPWHEARVAALARAAVIELARCVRAHRGTEAPAVRSGAQERVRKLVAEIAADPARVWTLGEMAAYCRLGRTRFATVFRDQTGDSPTRFLHRVRVREACRLLRETDRSITHIAIECGFGTSQYFAQIFKRCTGGLDARSYRRQSRG
ncbi:MAG: AraC family transcriptional regulator [Opitutaceae bacterium]|jgi:AraC-like DNA-binding protein|nr:AraC family transcriptional regulator [Opitutaceae bacterium]